MSIIFRNMSIVVLSLILHFYFYGSEHIKKMDYAFYDFLTILSPVFNSKEDFPYTVIIDIDEKSLYALGQWPWSRILDTQLMNRIQDLNPSVIGVNIMFPEEDRSSPNYIKKFYKDYLDLTVDFQNFPKELNDNDKLLANSLLHANATLGIYLHNGSYIASHCKELSYKKNIFSDIKNKLSSNSLLCNQELIQNSIENFGFINAWRDSDGVFRRVPLFMEYNNKIFPSFALATLLSFDSYTEVNRDEKMMLVNFSRKKPKVFSAVDILSAKVPRSEIENKIVIVGSSVVGLSSQYTTATNEIISNNMIHASIIDNILSNSLLRQPENYKKINILLSFLLSLFILILLSKKFYIHVVYLLFILGILSFSLLINLFNQGLYISIGYFWMPSFYFLIVILIYQIIIITKERQQQEKFLIRQSKLASMGEMIALIAHQWRQPLSTINGIVLNIDIDQRKEVLSEERLDRHLNKIEETTQYLSKTINDFTDFFSKNKIKDSFYINELITQSISLTAIESYMNVKIDYKKSKDIEVIGYKSELIQSLLIILNNAIYASYKNLSHNENGRIMIYTYPLNEHLSISIEDNGGGIDVKDIDKIFNPYFTTKDKAHGTGLGLYIVKMIIEDSMNGKISVRNGKEGAIFTIQIPLAL